MIKSMTGFGRAEVITKERKITVELKSVNHRYLDLSIKMPRKLVFLEGAIRNLMKTYMQRGKVDVFITYEDYTLSCGALKYNKELAGEYLAYIRQMAEEFGLENDVKAGALSRYPEILTMEEQTVDEEELWKSLEEPLREACEKFVETRTREGQHLREDLLMKLDGLDEAETTKRYMHHYNFPSYSVGETKPSRGPGRREIGHGALAERALLPVLPSEEEFPYAIRAVSETFESNGSTSMASTCASCMSLMAAGVPIKKMVAGISCGLVTGETDDDYLVLTDIQGLEDFFGDMDFKVTGTTEGITAIQMDIKIHGLTRPIVEEAIRRTREARLFIMEVMKGAIAEPRKEVGKYAPKIIRIQIDPAKIGDVVGQRGKTINEIIERTGVKIDITDDGAVSVCGVDADAMQKAVEMIRIITTDFEAGQIFKGTVISIKEFGAFVEFAPGKEGMVHISKIAKERINHVEDVLTLGDKVTVVCLGKDKMGRISFSIKDVPADAK